MKSVTFLSYFTVLIVFASALEAGQTSTETSPNISPENFTSTEANVNSVRYGRAYYGDTYLDDAYHECLNTKSAFSCFKYKSLRYIHKIALPSVENSLVSSSEGLNVMGNTIRLVSIPESMTASKEYVKSLFPDSQPRSSDSELERLYKFILREAEMFVRNHAIAMKIPTDSATSRDINAAQNPRIVDEDQLEKRLHDDTNVAEGRGKKKKLALVLPILLFFKLKMLLVPILLSVLFIKKLLILGAVLFPSLLSLVKLCKPSHGHSYSGWSSGPDVSGEYSTGYSHSVPYHSEYHGRRTGRWEPQSLAYRGYQRANEDQPGI